MRFRDTKYKLYFYALYIDRLPILIDLLKQKGYLSYQEYLSDPNLNYTSIIEKLNKNASSLWSDEIYSITDWFCERNEILYLGIDWFSKKNHDIHSTPDWIVEISKKEMLFCGLEEFYKIGDDWSNLALFLDCIRDFDRLSGNKLSSDKSTTLFKNFLDYQICFSGELLHFENKYYKEKPKKYHYDENSFLEDIINQVRVDGNLSMYELATREIIRTVHFYQSTIAGTNINIQDHSVDFNFQRELFYYSYGLRKKLKSSEGHLILFIDY